MTTRTRFASPRPNRSAALRVLLILAAGSIVAVAAVAAPLPPSARVEIDQLLSNLESSGCELGRSGEWYTGAEAKSHLLRKLQYLEDHGTVQSTEQFIELAATGSSMSGRPYPVRCTKGAPVPSATWLRLQLQALRKSQPAKNGP
jgi:hypothetical protein